MARHLLPIIALLVSCAFLLAGGGLHGIILPVRGQMEGFSTFQIGWIGTGWAVGFTLGCIWVPRLVRNVGHIRTFSTLAALLSTVMLMNALVVDAMIWILLRAIAGLCFSGSYMIMESWLNERMTNENRGAIFSIYMLVSLAATMGGQYLIIFADPKLDTLFMMGAILYALAVLPTAMSRAQSPAPLTQVDLDLMALFRNSPVAAVGSILAGIISSTWGNFAPVYGQQSGMTAAGIATLMAAAMVGAVVFQYPLGKLSDKIDRRYAMVLAGCVGAISGFALSTYAGDGIGSNSFYVWIVLYGGVIYSIYSLNVAHANDMGNAEDFVKIASGLLILYGIGTMIGPLMAAQMMAEFGIGALFLTTTIAHLAYAAYAFYRSLRRAAVEDEDHVDFQVGPLARAQTPETYQLDPRSDAETYADQGED